MNTHRVGAALLLLALLAACDSLTAPRSPGSLAVEVEPTSLALTNRTASPVYLLAFEEQTAMLSLWGPCTEPQQPCPSVAPGGRLDLPFSRIAGYEPGQPQTVLVYWWHLVPAEGGGLRPDSIRVVRVSM